MKNDLLNKNLIVQLCFKFALNIISTCERLERERKFILSNQLLKSGTSIGANVMEAQNAESKSDFIHKMKVGAKEADECQFWLMLCLEAYEPKQEFEELLRELQGIQAVLGKIITTSKRKSLLRAIINLLL